MTLSWWMFTWNLASALCCDQHIVPVEHYPVISLRRFPVHWPPALLLILYARIENLDVIWLEGSRRHRGGACGCPYGLRNPARHPQHRNPGPDVMQSLDRGHWQGAFGQGGRCARRRHGRGNRRSRHPVPDPQFKQGAGGARNARPGRPRALQTGDPRPPGKSTAPARVPATG